jgi:virginiamycin B lyase
MALFGTNQIGRIAPADGALKLFPLPERGARPRRLVADPRGIVWYTDYARGALGRLDPVTGAVREFPAPGGGASGPYGIAIAPDGRIWYDEAHADALVVFDPVTEQSRIVPIPTPGAIVRNMSVDSTRQRLWLALSGTARLGMVQLAPAR